MAQKQPSLPEEVVIECSGCGRSGTEADLGQVCDKTLWVCEICKRPKVGNEKCSCGDTREAIEISCEGRFNIYSRL